MTVMYATISHTDGYEQSYACAYPDHTPTDAYEYMLSVLTSTGLRPEGNEDTLTITTHTPGVQVVRTFTGGIA